MRNSQPPRADQAARLILTTLGGASLTSPGTGQEPQQILGPGKPLSLVAYLAFSPGRSATREHLIDLLWANLEPQAARHALRQMLWYLRRQLGEDFIVATDAYLTLRAPVESDRDAFLEAIDRLEFERAVELYKGDFLPAFAAPGGADFEHWADLERDRLRILFLRAAEAVVRDSLSKGHFRRAREVAARARDADRYNESAWRLLLESLLAANDRVAAEIEAHALEQLLAEEDRPPEPATEALLALVRETPAEEERAAPRRTLVAELVGRQREFSAIITGWRAVRREAGRHIHITGSAGLGKTRLLADVHGRLRAMGARAVCVRANPGERHVPYTLASEVALALAKLPGAAVSQGAASALVALNPSLSAQYAVSPDRTTDLEALRHREIAVGELLAAVAAEDPVALLIDDVHWADVLSKQILESLIARSSGQQVLIVTTARPGPERAIAATGTEQITVGPLSADETSALLASLGSLPEAGWASRLPQELHAAAHGSPLLILETLQLALERGWLTLQDGVWGCPDPAILSAEFGRGGALRRRVEELSRHESWLLLLLSVAGTPLNARLLAAAAGRDEDGALGDLFGMEVRGLVVRDGQDWAPAHDEIAERACEVAGPDAIRAAHEAIGEAVARIAGSNPQLLYRAGRHLAQGEDESRLCEVFARWVTTVRQRGDRRALRTLAGELLGTAGDSTQSRRLVATLPPHMRFGLTSKRRVAVAAALAATLPVLAASALVYWQLGRTRAENVPLFGGGGTILVKSANGSPRAIQFVGSAHRDTVGVPFQYPAVIVGGLAHLSPSRDLYAYQCLPAGANAPETCVAPVSGGEPRILASQPGDDSPGPWSPDGEWLLLWSDRGSEARYSYDIFVVNFKSGRVRQISRDPFMNAVPEWSPDGSRIAYISQLPEGDSLWVMTFDGERLAALGFRANVSALRWSPNASALAIAASDRDRARVFLMYPDGDYGPLPVAELRPGPSWLAWSPDGQILAVSGETSAGRRLMFIPTESAVSEPLYWDEEIEWIEWLPSRPPPFLDRLSLPADSARVAVGGRMQMQVVGTDQYGQQYSPPQFSLWVEDPRLGWIDQAGTFRGLIAGETRILASAGGWRADTMPLGVTPPKQPVLLFEERWDQGIDTTRWKMFGEPLPSAVPARHPGYAFKNNGDAKYVSGAVTRQTFSTSDGLTVEWLQSTPLTGDFWQEIWIDLSPLPLDGFRAGLGEPYSGPNVVTVRAPILVYQPPVPKISAGCDKVPVLPYPAALQGRAWHRLALQLHPDGTCDLLVDDRLVISTTAVRRLAAFGPVRLVVAGRSFNTDILVDDVRVWSGIWWAVLADSTAMHLGQLGQTVSRPTG